MKKILTISFFLYFQNFIYAQNLISLSEKNQIVSVLKSQETDWNEGDIDSFMKGYLNSNDLVFNGSKGPFYGFKSVKERYKNTYPTKNEMGKLKFEILKISDEISNSSIVSLNCSIVTSLFLSAFLSSLNSSKDKSFENKLVFKNIKIKRV